MNHGSLFSGIGGFDLAAQRMGWTNRFHCESNPFCKKILQHYWPQATHYDDIKQTDFTIWRGRIDILTGGFPCQPYSHAGKRLGTNDERHLWPEMRRAIREIKPRYVVAENVYGLVNWNDGLVFEEVQADLEAEGYTVQAYLLPAAGVGAPHKRYRVWFVAHANSHAGKPPRAGGQTKGHRGNQHKQPQSGQLQAKQRVRHGHVHRANTNTHAERLQGRQNHSCAGENEPKSNQQPTRLLCERWRDFPTEPPLFSRDDGLSDRLDGVTLLEWQRESVRGFGNAIVPEVALQIFKVIEMMGC